MLASFLITFREALEAALIIGIIAAYLARIGRKDLYRYLYMGIISALIASTGVALAFKLIYGELEGLAEELFEGIAALSFISVFREGVETVLFLGTLAITSPLDTLIGFILGVATVVFLSLAMFKGIHRLDVSRFFRYTSILLILFSAGLIATGVHELNEAGIIPPVVEHVWDLKPPVNPDGTYPPLHENGIIGSSLKSLAGYNANPSLTEVIAYIGYWLVTGLFVYRTYRVTAASKAGEVRTYGS